MGFSPLDSHLNSACAMRIADFLHAELVWALDLPNIPRMPATKPCEVQP